jgi:lambda repressor-like predicted transcriptional regulator
MKKSKATEALRVAKDIAAIKAALHKRGYRLRKQPKQPVWKVIITPDYFYTLTYQPTPISAWVLHPQNNHTRYQTIEAIIQNAIKKQPENLNRRAGR